MSKLKVIKDALEQERSHIRVYSGHLPSSLAPVSIRQTEITSVEEANFALRESFALSLLDHPNVVKMYECYFEENTLFCLVTERLGRTLAMEIEERRRAQRQFSEQEVWEVLVKLVSGLYYAERMHVYHRDIKPENVYIVDSQVKLGNFQNAESQNIASGQSMIVGSPYYFSPELKQAYKSFIHTHSFSPILDQGKADVYSLGVTVLEMVMLGKSEELKRLEGLQEYTNSLERRLVGYENVARCLGYMMTVDPAGRVNFQQLYEWIVPEEYRLRLVG